MPGASRVAVMGDAVSGSLVHEIKYVLPASCAAPAEAWLGAVCRPEAARPPARVCTVYFDTPELDLLDEKANSDYLKTKIRVRWYEPLDGPATGPAFLEVKARIGSRRDKERAALAATGAELSRWPIDDPRWLSLVGPVSDRMPCRLVPTVRLRYVRSRFIDVLHGSRVALDRHIDVIAVRPTLQSRALPARVDAAIFEWKGATPDLPGHLGALVRFGARRRSFSKYLAAIDAATGA